MLDLCHYRRNAAEYEGHFDIEEQLVADLLVAADSVLEAVLQLDPIKTPR